MSETFKLFHYHYNNKTNKKIIHVINYFNIADSDLSERVDRFSRTSLIYWIKSLDCLACV